MSYIEILILRRLRSGPAHGYELRKRVEQTTGFVLHNNSLYPALRRFEEAGAVTKTAEAQDGRPPRLVYTLTEVGQELLHDMLADLPPDQAAMPGVPRPSRPVLFDQFRRTGCVLASRTHAVRDSWRTTGRCANWRWLAASGGARWPPPS